ATLLVALERTGHYRFNDRGTEAAEVFVSLLLGELQMQQALGTIPALTEQQIAARARSATAHFDRLFSA
ncbi:MAG: TetR/AcrR family transcriptional regulator C-terminal domain-containing protein, partial [Pseudomonadota bacterium]